MSVSLAAASQLFPFLSKKPAHWHALAGHIRCTAAQQLADVARRAGGSRGMAKMKPVGMQMRKADSLRIAYMDHPPGLNCFNLERVEGTIKKLTKWENSEKGKLIVMTNIQGLRCYSIGVDYPAILKRIATRRVNEVEFALLFFEQLYRLAHMIATLSKPFMCIIDGIAMGSPVGLSSHGMFRIATNNTDISVPEVSIGLFPDAGSTFFLSRLDNEIGTYMALTGYRLKGIDAVIAGYATHYVDYEALAYMYRELCTLPNSDPNLIKMIVNKYAIPFTSDMFENWALGGKVGESIKRCFKYDTVEEIIEALRAEDTKWAQKQLTAMRRASPISLKVTLALLRRAAKSDLAKCLRLEFRTVRQILRGYDFLEGVASRIVDNPPTRPVWRFSIDDIEQVPLDGIESSYFEINGPELVFDKQVTLYEYPHHTFSDLPMARDIKLIVEGKAQRGKNMTPFSSHSEVLNWIWNNWGCMDPALQGKQPQRAPLIRGSNPFDFKYGVWEKAAVLLEQLTEVRDGRVVWKEGESLSNEY